MSHHKGLSNLPNQDSVFALSLECLLVVLYGLFWLLDVHEGSCHQFEVFYRTLCIQDFEVASRVVVSVLQLIKINLGLLLLGLNETAIRRLDLFEHVEGFLRISHL